MTDPIPPTAGSVATPTSRWVRILLVISLSLNLLFLGLAAGAMLRGGPAPGGRDFGLGPLSEALSREDRKALRAAFLDRHPDLRAERQEMRTDFDRLVQALRADPLDPQALDEAIAAITRRNTDLLETGRALVAARLSAMDATERAAFADRLEKGLRRWIRRNRDHAD